jgi:hypothetical protein
MTPGIMPGGNFGGPSWGAGPLDTHHSSYPSEFSGGKGAGHHYSNPSNGYSNNNNNYNNAHNFADVDFDSKYSPSRVNGYHGHNNNRELASQQ